MRVLCMLRADKESEAGAVCGPETMAKMGQLIDEMTKAGVLLATEGLQPSSKGVRVRYTGEKFILTDGPFAETKELIASFALLHVQSMAEAVAWTTRFTALIGPCECEIRPIQEAPELAPEVFPSEEVAREAAWRDKSQPSAAPL